MNSFSYTIKNKSKKTARITTIRNFKHSEISCYHFSDQNGTRNTFHRFERGFAVTGEQVQMRTRVYNKHFCPFYFSVGSGVGYTVLHFCLCYWKQNKLMEPVLSWSSQPLKLPKKILDTPNYFQEVVSLHYFQSRISTNTWGIICELTTQSSRLPSIFEQHVFKILQFY